MLTHSRNRISTNLITTIVLISLFSVIFTAVFRTFADSAPTKAPSADGPQTLEGMRFQGPFGVEGETNPGKDIFTFEDGKFFAEGCLEWGFKPAPYWLRKSAEGTHFLAELESPEHGTMSYEGVFNGSELKAKVFWKKERWYWTIERTYWFQGHPTETVE